ncbi:hypothetical protein INS49_000827 [Diaporthe citri]|uniref:uncharacterized protein n=1 Tax=Diaporthe citri TaxID=83186 RepID=UPI001C7FE3D2|nr:uncharacterized protein INS49_000827 [Diaporthe citri]KAG6366648.1 hypothetical protein INS49_000827 [Diaporthe citri]
MDLDNHGSSSPNSTPRQRSSSQPSEGPVKRNDEHDSLVTVRLSEPPKQLTLNTNVDTNGTIQNRRSLFSPNLSASPISPSPLSASSETKLDDEIMSPVTTTYGSKANLQEELDALQDNEDDSKTISGVEAAEESDDDDEEVNWDQLQKTEDAVVKDNDSEDSTAMLLARLEQANDELATNPKSIKAKSPLERVQQSARKPRPPSMAQLREMVQGPVAAPLRYSMLPPPPMTDLEFYAALVKDYQQTAARLPTLLSNKIRKGIPPPLRGVVWQSMSGARDSTLEDAFERFTGESSPYEGLIGKDLGRSFPGVDMFRDPDGDGQRMLGRVLKCYSLYDQKIGYCQGLALLVGPLLMHMTDKQAFCVLVKLMENYDLRSSFTPDLHGLHVKIYQFRELLKLDLPALSGHLDDLQVDPAYVSQWFLSFFAVTCPLPMLFRIYDVIFAEGAIETIMRVALSLMRKNQGRILACTEMEDVLQLLLSRGLWDCYHYNADEFVHDFVSLSSVVTRERLAALEQGYRESQLTTPPTSTGANAARASAVSTAASRFLGRLWANSTTSLKASPNTASANLSPGAASRPMSMLRRTASTEPGFHIELDGSQLINIHLVRLECTYRRHHNLPRDSTADDSATPGKLASQNNNSDSKNLHTQIEDLLVALSDLQRQHAQLADQLQKEREEREEDRAAVRTLLTGLRKKGSNETLTTAHSGDSEETITPGQSIEKLTAEGLSELLDSLEDRFGSDSSKRRSSITQTKTQMRDDVSRAKEHLRIEMTRTQDANRRALDLEEEIKTIKEQLRESHAHVRNLHNDKQRLEKQVHSMRVRASDSTNDSGGGWLSRSPSTKSTAPGLREFKLNRSKSTPSQITVNKRTSSLLMIDSKEPMPPPPTSAPKSASPTATQKPPPGDENEALLLELVEAKTAQAVARQEADEAKQKLEQLRKMVGLPSGDQPAAAQPAAASVMGMFRSFSSPAAEATPAADKAAAPVAPAPTPAAAPAPASSGGGFWGWGRK